MLKAILSEPITRTIDFSSFEIASVLDDYENERVVATVKSGGTTLPLILWAGADYSASRNWTNATVIARVREILPAALA